MSISRVCEFAATCTRDRATGPPHTGTKYRLHRHQATGYKDRGQFFSVISVVHDSCPSEQQTHLWILLLDLARASVKYASFSLLSSLLMEDIKARGIRSGSRLKPSGGADPHAQNRGAMPTVHDFILFRTSRTFWLGWNVKCFALTSMCQVSSVGTRGIGLQTYMCNATADISGPGHV